jgi:hypothetical protein
LIQLLAVDDDIFRKSRLAQPIHGDRRRGFDAREALLAQPCRQAQIQRTNLAFGPLSLARLRRAAAPNDRRMRMEFSTRRDGYGSSTAA